MAVRAGLGAVAVVVCAVVAAGVAGAQEHRTEPGPEGAVTYSERERPGPAMRLSVEQREVALELLDALRPEQARWLRAAGPESGPEAARLVHRVLPRLRLMVHMREHDPQMYELRLTDLRLERQADDLASSYRMAVRQDDRGARRDAEDALEVVLERQFELRQELRELELQRLESRLEQLREQLNEREDQRDELIESRLTELLGPDW